jgi:hypothetical protein
MALPNFRIRWVGRIAVVGISADAAGEPVPPGVSLGEICSDNLGVVLDFAGCKLVSSEFIGHLIRAHRAAMARGSRLRVSCPEGLPQWVLSEVKLDRVLPVYAILAEALNGFDLPLE